MLNVEMLPPVKQPNLHYRLGTGVCRMRTDWMFNLCRFFHMEISDRLHKFRNAQSPHSGTSCDIAVSVYLYNGAATRQLLSWLTTRRSEALYNQHCQTAREQDEITCVCHNIDRKRYLDGNLERRASLRSSCWRRPGLVGTSRP